MDKIKTSFLLRQWIAVRLVLQLLLGKLSTASENLGYYFFHLTIYGRKTGYIELGVEDIAADGKVRLLRVDEYRRVQIEEINFRIYNRWLVRDFRRCYNRVLWQMNTHLMAAEGLKLHSVLWGAHSHQRVEYKPFDLTRLPDEAVIQERNARLKRFQDRMGRWFPARQPTTGLTMRDAANDIIFRW